MNRAFDQRNTMKSYISALILLLITLVVRSEAMRHIVYWDGLKTPELEKDGLVVTVVINDYMDVLCPLREEKGKAQTLDKNKKYLHLYNVTHHEFTNCDTRRGVRVLTCKNPMKEAKLTTKFQIRSPSPLGFKFRPGETYYYLSKPLHDQVKGCTKHTMKMIVQVKSLDKAIPARHFEESRTYHTIKIDHRNTSRKVVNDDEPDVINEKHPHRSHHHHKNNEITNQPKTDDREMSPKMKNPSLSAVRSNPPGNGAEQTMRSLLSIVTYFLCLLVTRTWLTIV